MKTMCKTIISNKTFLSRAIAVLLATMLALNTLANDEPDYSTFNDVVTTTGNMQLSPDTLNVYTSWTSMFNATPDTLLLNAGIRVRSPYDYEIKVAKKDKITKKMLKKSTVAVSIGDSIFLINSDWIKRSFDGDCSHFSRYVPLYFSAKIAFVQFQRNNPTVGGALLNLFVDVLTGTDTGIGLGDGYNNKTPKLYLLDFGDKRVKEVNQKLLMQLLSPYSDLQRRYESMKNREETHIVNEFFLQLVDRLTQDPTVQYLF